MKTDDLFRAFADSHRWNALVQLIHKASFAILSFSLYKALTVADYSIWANANSTIFLTLLWLDFGLRKTIPRYAPRFADSTTNMRRFVIGVALIQITLILIALPFLIWNFRNWTSGTCYSHTLPLLAGSLFLVEGANGLLRLLHHAYFWVKQFNRFVAMTALIETMLALVIIWAAPPSATIVLGILSVKLVTALMLAGAAIWQLHTLLQRPKNISCEEKKKPPPAKELVIHAGAMWTTNTLKSLSERNFMFPFLTHTMGAELANLFKVSNDAALFFYRMVLKTIGSTDTTLFAHVDVVGWRQNLVATAFDKLSIRVAALVIPLLGIAVLCTCACSQFCVNGVIFQLFLIMTVAYLLEMILLPYERVLEVQRRYAALARTYIPYLVAITMLLATSGMTSIGLVGTVLAIHIVRLVTLLLISRTVQRDYRLLLPIKRIALLMHTLLFGIILIIILVIL